MKKVNHTSEYASAALQPTIDYIHAHKGTLAKIQREAERLSGLTFAHTQIGPYFHKDSAKRHEPRLGMGLLLIQAALNVIGEAK